MTKANILLVGGGSVCAIAALNIEAGYVAGKIAQTRRLHGIDELLADGRYSRWHPFERFRAFLRRNDDLIEHS